MPESQITTNGPQTAKTIANLLHDLFKAAGVSMISVEGHEQIRTIAQKLSETIEYHAEWKAVDVSKALQEAVKCSFEGIELDIVAQKAATEAQQKRFDGLGQAFLVLEKEVHKALLSLKNEVRDALAHQEDKTTNLLHSLREELTEAQTAIQELKDKLRNAENHSPVGPMMYGENHND